MTETLFSISLALAKVLGNVRSSTTTAAGSATTIVDSTRTEPADFWNDGTLWITSGTHSGKSRKITDWALSGTTFTIPTTTTAAGAGVTYSVIDGNWPQDKLVEFINRALVEIGDVPQDDASLTTVAEQEEYTLPSGVYNVRQVEIARELAAPYAYQQQYGNWYERDGVLRFATGREPQEDDYLIRLTYMAPHAALTADTGTVSQYIHPDLLVWTAAVHAWRWRTQMGRGDEPTNTLFYQEALGRADRERRLHRIPQPIKAVRNSL